MARRRPQDGAWAAHGASKRPSEGSRTPQRTAQRLPRMPKSLENHCFFNIFSNLRQLLTNAAQDGPKTAQDIPKTAPRRLQDGSKSHLLATFSCLIVASLEVTCPDPPKTAPRWRKMAPRWPKMAQDTPKMAPRWLQEGPKTAQDGPKMAPRWKMKAR